MSKIYLNFLFIIFIDKLVQLNTLHLKRIDQIYDFYSNDQQIQSEIDRLIQNNKQLYSKKLCSNDNNYSYVQIGSVNNQFKEKNLSTQNKLKAIIVCNIHARQFITSQICLQLIKNLQNHKEITNKMSFKVFYRANKMRQYTLTHSDNCIRKNENNVDLNRNFPTQFNFYNASKNSEIYPGVKPFSQTFTFCLNQIIQNQVPDLFLDLHSGQRSLYYQEGVNNQAEIQIVKGIKKNYPKLNITKITTLKKDHESINGHIFADLKARKFVKYSLLFQTYGIDEDHKSLTCFEEFNPQTEKDLNKWKGQWTKAIFYTLNQVIKNEN